MDHIKKFSKTNPGYKLIWLVVISSILVSLYGTRLELKGLNLNNHPVYRTFLAPFDNVRYGHFVARKLFLVVIAFLVLAYWLIQQKKWMRAALANLKYFFLIGAALTASKILTFGFWFYNDDTRLFSWHLFSPTRPDYNIQGLWGPVGFHPIALIFPALNWFGTNYTLYNILALIFFFLAGVAIFILANKLQDHQTNSYRFAPKKLISLIATLFFLTTPTYFQGRLLIGEIVNSPFILLLFILAILMLLLDFIPGALIFTAAALEYGVAKTYFIALPLTLIALFFANRNTVKRQETKGKMGLLIFVAAVWLMSFVYKDAFFSAPGGPKTVDHMLSLDQLFVFGDVLLSVILPYGLTYPLVHLGNLILNGWIYFTIVSGFLALALLLLIGIISYLKGKDFTVKLLIIGLLIIIPCAAVASYKGVRVERKIQKLVEYHLHNQIPMGATSYGFFPAVGLTFILIGSAYLLQKRIFLISSISLVLFNIITSVSFDYKWLQSPYAYPQRRYDEQLNKILPRSNNKKYVYVPSLQRPFYQGVVTFIDVFQGDQSYNLFMDLDEFTQALMKEQPKLNQVYFLMTKGKPNYEIINYSDKLHVDSYEKLSPIIYSFLQQLPYNTGNF